MILGRDPVDPFIGHERTDGDAERTYGTGMRKVLQLVNEKKLPILKQHKQSKTAQYESARLIALGKQMQLGYCNELAKFKRGIGLSPAAGNPKPKSVKSSSAIKLSKIETADSIPDQRAKLVYRFAFELSGKRHSANRRDIELTMQANEFAKQLNKRYGAIYPNLANCGSDAMAAARLNRDRLPDLPKVHFKRGRPNTNEKSKSPLPQKTRPNSFPQ